VVEALGFPSWEAQPQPQTWYWKLSPPPARLPVGASCGSRAHADHIEDGESAEVPGRDSPEVFTSPQGHHYLGRNASKRGGLPGIRDGSGRVACAFLR
jgi:hypothetical protein